MIECVHHLTRERVQYYHSHLKPPVFAILPMFFQTIFTVNLTASELSGGNGFPAEEHIKISDMQEI